MLIDFFFHEGRIVSQLELSLWAAMILYFLIKCVLYYQQKKAVVLTSSGLIQLSYMSLTYSPKKADYPRELNYRFSQGISAAVASQSILPPESTSGLTRESALQKQKAFMFIQDILSLILLRPVEASVASMLLDLIRRKVMNKLITEDQFIVYQLERVFQMIFLDVVYGVVLGDDITNAILFQ